MRPIFSGGVKICSPIRLKEQEQVASFSVKHGKDTFFVRTVGLGQYEMMTELQHAGYIHLFIFGHMFSYHVPMISPSLNGVEPLWIVPLDRYDGDLATLRSIAAQYFTASLLTLDYDNNHPRRGRLQTQPLTRS